MKRAVALALVLGCNFEVEVFIPGEGIVKIPRAEVVDKREVIVEQIDVTKHEVCRCSQAGFCYDLMDDTYRFRSNCPGQQACEITDRKEIYEVQYRFRSGQEGTSPRRHRAFELHRRLTGVCR